MGTFTVSGTNETRKKVLVQEASIVTARTFNAAQFKLYHEPETIEHAMVHDAVSYVSETTKVWGVALIIATEVLGRHDPCSVSLQTEVAKRTEVQNLMRRGTFKVIHIKDVPPDGSVLPGSLFLGIKTGIDGRAKEKALILIGGHRDRLKDLVLHSSQTIHPHSIRLFLVLAEVFCFDI